MKQSARRKDAFVKEIEQQLDSGDLVFPSSMQAAVKVRRALEDPSYSLSSVAKVINLEPVLSMKLLRMANSAFFSRAGGPVSDVQRALLRVGVEHARILAFAVIGDQLASAVEFAKVGPLAHQLWRHSVDVASLAYAVAVQLELPQPDTALLAGMVHDIGQFYLLSRVNEYPELLEGDSELAELILYWDKRVGQAVLRGLGGPEEIVDSLDDQNVLDPVWPPRRLSEITFLADSTTGTPNPFSTVPLEMQIRLRQVAFQGVAPEVVTKLIDAAIVHKTAALAMLNA